jgi:hypothetical protein
MTFTEELNKLTETCRDEYLGYFNPPEEGGKRKLTAAAREFRIQVFNLLHQLPAEHQVRMVDSLYAVPHARTRIRTENLADIVARAIASIHTRLINIGPFRLYDHLREKQFFLRREFPRLPLCRLTIWDPPDALVTHLFLVNDEPYSHAIPLNNHELYPVERPVRTLLAIDICLLADYTSES